MDAELTDALERKRQALIDDLNALESTLEENRKPQGPSLATISFQLRVDPEAPKRVNPDSLRFWVEMLLRIGIASTDPSDHMERVGPICVSIDAGDQP